MNSDLLIMKLWREFKETTLETLKLLLLEKLLDRDEDFVRISKPREATLDVLARRDTAYTLAVAKVNAIRVVRNAKALVLRIVGIDEDIIHEALCTEDFCACRPEGTLTSEESVVRVRFELPSPGLMADSSCFSKFALT